MEKDWKGREYTPEVFQPRQRPPRLFEYFGYIIWYGVPFSIIYTIVNFLSSLLQ